MKEINELNLPDDILYSEDHEWVRSEGDIVRVGITDYAQDQLGDITFVELPKIGETFELADEFGTLESTKAVSEMLIPVSGEILGINPALEESPELVNHDSYGEGWLVEIKPSNPNELNSLMSMADYMEMLKGLD
jgi:glycine cleavage system H protein